ncbi:MAG TPA: hypothetical protein VFQ98_01495 [Gallionella sp.]|nr:hypothetical protein [Gallionella sp.]
MQKRTLLNVMLLAAPLMLPPLALAAAGASAAAQTQQGMTAEEHASHAEPAGTGRAWGKGGMAGGAGKPMAWTAFPMLKTRMSGEGREGRVVTVIPQGIVANSIDAYSNDIKDAKGHRQLPLDMSGAKLDKPEAGGFHWLTAREEQDGKVRVASTVQFFANPGKNPTAMFMQQKHELEIIPQPYPREHSRYRANEDWKFLVRFNSKPLANQKVSLETQNGTRIELVSNAQGVITVHLPDDFKAEAEQKTAGSHDHGRRSSDFVLAIEHAEGGKSYLTAFNGSYGPDAFDQRSLAMGLGFTLLGMIGAVPLLRQRKDAKKAAGAGQSTDAPAAAEATKNEDA